MLNPSKLNVKRLFYIGVTYMYVTGRNARVKLLSKFFAPLAQLDRASAFGAEGWGFESLQARFSCNLLLEMNVRALIISKY